MDAKGHEKTLSTLSAALKIPIRKPNKVTGLKILTPTKMLQRLPLALVKAGNISKNLLNKIHQIIFFVSSKRNHWKSI